MSSTKEYRDYVLDQLESLKEIIPYPNAKPMFYIGNVDNTNFLREIIVSTYNELTIIKKG